MTEQERTDGLFFTGVIANVKEDTTKNGKVFQVLKFFVNTKKSCFLFTVKNFSSRCFEQGQQVIIPVFHSSRVWNDRAYVDYIYAGE